jgi:hypothetical protein
MFIGHYAAALALKPADKRVSLFWLFLAATWLDLVFDLLGLAGIEKLRIVPGFTAANSLDLYFYPFSHSLLAALLWSALAYGIVRILPTNRLNQSRTAMVIALAVFSHWLLDWITHAPDLSLWGGEVKTGLGLWNSVLLSFVVESVLFAVALGFYLVSMRGERFRRRWGVAIFSLVLYTMFAMTSLSGEAPPSVQALLGGGLLTNLLAALVAGWLDKPRASIVLRNSPIR